MHGSPAPPPLVGRDSQVAALRDFVDAVAKGDGRALVLRGDAGTGKTRLTRELLELARAADMVVLSGGCVAVGGEPMRHAALMDLMAHADRQGVAGLSTEAVLERVLATVEELVDPATVLVVVEDVHWADRGTCEVLTVLARRVGDRPLGLVMTCRDDEVAPEHHVRAFMTELGRTQHVTQLRVDALAAADAATLIESLLGNVDAVTLARIYQRSGGNPLVIEELCAGGVESAGLALDGPLREIMLTRFWRLGPSARDVVRAIAVSGASVDHDQLRAVVRLDDVALTSALREALDLHVVTLNGAAIAFRHVLMAEAVYSDLLPGERVPLHTAWAQMLGDSANAQLLAHHWYEAGQYEQAFTASLAAAAEAGSALAFDASHRHYLRALSLWDRVPDASARAGASHVDVCLRAAEAANWAGDLASAVAQVDAGLASIDADDDPLSASVSLERRGWYLLRQGTAAAARLSYEQALAVLPADADPATRARVLAGSVRAYERASDYDQALSIATEALDIAVAADATTDIGPARYMLGRMLLMTGDVDGAIAELSKSARAAEDTLNPVLLAVALLEIGDALARKTRIEDAVPLATGAAQRLRARGFVEHALLATATAAALELRRGRPAPARELVTTILADASTPVTLALGHLLAGAIAVEDESLAVARDHLGTARLLAAPLLDGRVGAALATARADIAIAERELDAAAAVIDEGVRKVAHSGDDEALAHLCLLGLRVEAQRDADALGRSSERSRQRRAGRIRGYERHIDRVLAAAPPGVDRPELRAIDLARTAERGRLDGQNDSVAWQDSANAWDAVQLPRWAAYAKTRYVEALVASGAAPAEIDLAFSRATDAAHAIGSRLALGDVARLAQRAGATLPETVPVTGVPELVPDIAGLTPREREVLDLVVEGATNKQIASRLFISEKTASVHVSRILTKLGATSRQEAAALARRARR